MANPDDRLHIFIVAGEPSGDVLGARLMAALNRVSPNRVKYSGVGGPRMAAEGLESLFDYRQLAVMGLLEVLPQAPRLLRRIRDVARAIEAAQPDAIITIDAPSFGFAVLKRLKTHNQPRIHYVAPQVWAWRPKRAGKIKKYVDHVLALLPFEAPYFDAAGMPCTFVGHPILENVASTADGKAFRARHGIGDDALVLCALPGSRRNEVRKLKPVMADVIGRIAARYQNLHVVIPTVSTVADDVRDLASIGVPTTITDNADEKSAAMAASDAAIAASGTATLELVCANVPTVVIYKVALITGWLGRYLTTVKYASIANILADRELLPEFLQEYCKPKDVAAALIEIIEDDTRRREVIDGEIDVVRQLAFEGQAPSEKAAQEVLRIIDEFKHR
jgi:lipid-A-disaccharide synthase